MLRLEYGRGTDQDRRSRVILSSDELVLTTEYLALARLIEAKGKLWGYGSQIEVRRLVADEFDDITTRIGLSLLANVCFETDMGLAGVSVVNDEYCEIFFGVVNGDVVSVFGQKSMDDPYGRRISYVDIVGVLPEYVGLGLGKEMAKMVFDGSRKEVKRDVVVVSRTQNPMMVGVIKGGVEGVIYPFESEADCCWVESVRWLVGSGKIARNDRIDSRFCVEESLIYWGAYGFVGDGSTWENMIKSTQYRIDWERGWAKKMNRYLEEHGTSYCEALRMGHAFVFGAMMKFD